MKTDKKNREPKPKIILFFKFFSLNNLQIRHVEKPMKHTRTN